MIKRYSTEEMEKVWIPLAKFTNWARIEIAVLEAKKIIGELTVDIPDNLLASIKINPKKIDKIEAKKTKHDVIAFLMHTEPQLPPELQSHWHQGLTSMDVQDTGLSLQLVASVRQLLARIEGLMVAIEEKAIKFKYTPMIGRTHGIHAEPITFGVKLANWYSELERCRERLERLLVLVAVGTISGAVGMYTLDPRIEEIVCEILYLEPITATQIISRDIIAEYATTLAIIAGSLEKIAVTGRTLQRTEILEAQEFFDINQRGSSAMPHKKNPIGFENVSGLVRIIRHNASVALEQISTWDERSIDNSGSERIFLPDSSILLDYLLKRLTDLISKWIIYPEKIKENIGLTKGLIYSQDVQKLVAEKSNLPKQKAYGLVREVALLCWQKKTDFLEELLKDKKIIKYVSQEELKKCFDLDKKLQYVDYIFKKVFD